MKRYTLAVTSPEYWSQIHNVLTVDSNQDGIPDRKITCTNPKEQSPTRSNYELTEEEAAEIAKHPLIEWIELSYEDHPEAYDDPVLFEKRFPQDVKVYRDLADGNAPASSSPSAAELNRTNWAIARVGVDTSGDLHGTNSGQIAPITGNFDFSLTGKNVDVIIMDSGVLAAHPEFLDANGKSRVLDIILDGPYIIDPAYFNSNSLTYTRPDGRIGITTASAKAWWENSSSRSGAFSSIGTVSMTAFNSYTEYNTIGTGTGDNSGLTSGHGTAAAGMAAGKNFGLAFEANIFNASMVSTPAGSSPLITGTVEAINIFNRNKPINPETGVKNPTVVNGSWGYKSKFSPTATVSYRFKEETGTFTGNAAIGSGTGQLVRAMKEGFYLKIMSGLNSGYYWTSGSGSNSVDTTFHEMMGGGGIQHVVASGNDNQRIGVGTADPHRLDYFTGISPYGQVPAGFDRPSIFARPTGHRDWMAPMNAGFSTTTDPNFHPTIAVGAMDDEINSDLSERKVNYSNNGPGIDIFAPADETLSAGVVDYRDYQRRDNSVFYDGQFGGTSSASPVTAGWVALYMQANPTATQRQCKDALFEHGSVVVEDSLYQDQYSDESTTNYWSQSYNLRGAQRRILRNKSASPTKPSMQGVNVTGVTFNHK